MFHWFNHVLSHIVWLLNFAQMCLTLGELYGLLAKTKYILSYHHHFFLIILSLLIIHYCIVNILSLCIHIYIYVYIFLLKINYVFSVAVLLSYFFLNNFLSCFNLIQKEFFLHFNNLKNFFFLLLLHVPFSFCCLIV